MTAAAKQRSEHRMHQPHPAIARPHHARRNAVVIYCNFNRKLKETDPLNRSWNYAYDLNNNITQITDAKAQTTQYTWSKGHQLVSMKDAAGKTTAYLRNPLGQVTTTQNPDASYAYTYDKTHRLASVTDNRPAIARIAAAKTLTYSYSPGGLLNKTEDTDGNRTDYLYDPVGRLSGIWAPNLDYVSYTYDAGGRFTEKWFPNGINAQYGYNTDNTLSQLKNRIGYSDNFTVSNHSYTYDGIGNRKQIQDQAGQLTAPATNQAYTFDPVNNRVTQSDGTTTQYAKFDAANQLTELHSGSLTGPLTMAFIYDANGNLTSKCEGSGVTTSGTSFVMNKQPRGKPRGIATTCSKIMDFHCNVIHASQAGGIYPKRLTDRNVTTIAKE